MKHFKIAAVAVFACLFVGFQLTNTERARGQASTPAAPTGFTASDNAYNNRVGLYWDTMRGATRYRVFRSSTADPSLATEIGTSVSNVFFDATVPAVQSFFYWVRAENETGFSELSTVDQGSRTGTNQQAPSLSPPPAPLENPVTATKTALGKALFWDEQLSSTGTVSCGTCHFPGNGGTDKRSVAAGLRSLNPGLDGVRGTPDDARGSLGVPRTNPDGTYQLFSIFGVDDQVTPRKSPSSIDAAYHPTLFWDGRAGGQLRDPITNAVVIPNGAALESQVLGPAVNDVEMAHIGRNWNNVASDIAASKPLALSPSLPAGLAAWIDGRSYPDLFLEAFGTSEVTPVRIAMAIATYERTLFGDQTPFDQFNSGMGGLTAAETRGRNLFNGGQTACSTCHFGALTADNAFHNTGVRPSIEDTGRFQVTNTTSNLGQFRTPSLRNGELKGSYLHNGQFTTLEEVVAFYNRGGDFFAPNRPPTIRPLNLSPQQQADLVAFLKRPLTDPRVAAELPPFDRPVLYTESDRIPQITGAGRSGSADLVPQIRAISPPLVGNSRFTVSVSSALGNSQAVLVIDENDPGLGSSIPAAGSLARIAVTTQNSGAGNGWASVVVPIPNSAAVVGKTYFARWYVQDEGAANGFSVSQAARFTVFGEAPGSAIVSISGRVLTPDGLGLRNATVTLTGPGNSVVRTTTSSFGIYTFENVPAGMSYFVGVASKRYRFSSRSIVPTANIRDFDLVGLE